MENLWGSSSTARAVLALAALSPLSALGAGFEFPDNGTEALGRGGAFVAKADDGTAIYYNVAGFAQQYGTRLTIDSNFILHDYSFTEAGSYSGDPTKVAYAGQPYPTVHDTAGVFVAPMAAFSTDFNQDKIGPLGHLVVAVGIYGPSSVGQRNYGYGGGTDQTATVKLPDGTSAPAPSRYDFTHTNLLTFFPTLAIALRPTKYLDIGISGQLVYSSFDLAGANLTPLGCKPADQAACDAYGGIKVSGITGTAMFSVLAHPTGWLDLGLTFRPEIDIHDTGTIHSQSPPNAGTTSFPDAAATFDTVMPANLRFGARVVKHYIDGSERADLEVDGTWEQWSHEQADHIHAVAAPPGNFLWRTDDNGNSYLDLAIVHNFHDTGSVRVGGSYTFRLGKMVRLTPRLGVYYDGSVGSPADMHLDFPTMEKVGLTGGLGLKVKGITLNVAYGYIYAPTVVVTNSEILAPTANHGSTLDPKDPHIVIGNGTYNSQMQILSVGLTINFNEAAGKRFFVH